MSDGLRARPPALPAEDLITIILCLIVFVFEAWAVMSGHLPLPHFAAPRMF